MSFKASNIIIGGDKIKIEPPTISPPSNFSNLELTDKELELLLLTIKNGLFKGEYVELIYNLTLKLQSHLVELKSKTTNS
jgi:hypothetical protein